MNRPNNEPTLEDLGLTPESSDVSEVHPSEWLEGPEDYVMYLNEALATGDAGYIAHCLKNIAEVAGANLPDNLMPSIESLFNMLRGVNVRLHAGVETAETA